MRIGSIASGSSGNSICIGSDNAHILIDAGISNKRIELGLKEMELKAEDLNAVFITHEHSDHIQGLKVFLKKHPCDLYTSEGTLRELRKKDSLLSLDESRIHIVRPGDSIAVGDLKIKPFSVDHDAAEPLAFRVDCDKKSVAVATDMGHYTEDIVAQLMNLDVLLIESNHDIRMLEAGPYPYVLKRRILSNFGHLSNESAGKLISRVLHDGTKRIILGHLSKENNFPELAYETVRCEISEAACPYTGDDFRINVASREGVSCITKF